MQDLEEKSPVLERQRHNYEQLVLGYNHLLNQLRNAPQIYNEDEKLEAQLNL